MACSDDVGEKRSYLSSNNRTQVRRRVEAISGCLSKKDTRIRPGRVGRDKLDAVPATDGWMIDLVALLWMLCTSVDVAMFPVALFSVCALVGSVKVRPMRKSRNGMGDIKATATGPVRPSAETSHWSGMEPNRFQSCRAGPF